MGLHPVCEHVFVIIMLCNRKHFQVFISFFLATAWYTIAYTDRGSFNLSPVDGHFAPSLNRVDTHQTSFDRSLCLGMLVGYIPSSEDNEKGGNFKSFAEYYYMVI